MPFLACNCPRTSSEAGIPRCGSAPWARSDHSLGEAILRQRSPALSLSRMPIVIGALCVSAATLPNVPIRFAKTSRDRRRKRTQDAPRGNFGARYVGGVGRNKSQFIATPCVEARAFGGRCLRSLAASGFVGFVGVGLGTSRCDAAGGNSNGAEGNDTEAGAATGPCSRPTGGHPPRGLPACALATSARARRCYAVSVSGRRSYAHHRSRL
jgi:hypothetical protein